jgi:REP element-mobilizing transposase RayT
VGYHAGVHHRRSIRLPTYDYRETGAYFVTICTFGRECILDDPAIGRALELAWRSIGRYCRPARPGDFVVMPNHVHGIVWLRRADAVGAQHTPITGLRLDSAPLSRYETTSDSPRAAPRRRLGLTRRVERGSLAAIVRAFRSNTSKRINVIRNTPGATVWQRNYYEHIIREEGDLLRICEYIRDNPAKWAEDPYNPANQIQQTHPR